ncbi:hypothetical protein A2V80_03115 [Candidatus Woesebacteria bacterium RBG_16_39_8b]|uniref:Glycosyltransferase 2-like domain-containing protein n=1 Tax=Candidatus Woesebacteria bacterium RBG_16_39_8b TaxID=1802482 RepID=A0A1F7XCX9_9BACT|nr:MAG: hypothetical protein A2V80_03115 [Candidatus Woesebacteria bacterium RBG_16_39_8b]
MPIRYISETKKGLSHARNRGIDESNGDIVIFLDDDVLVDKAWLAEMLRVFNRTNADCVGGRVFIKWAGKPEFPLRECENKLISFDKGDADREMRGRSVPIGANLAFKRSVFEKGLRFNTELGRTGACLISGEEIELIWKLQRNNKSVWYAAKSIVYHRLEGERCTKSYYFRRHFWFGVSYALIDREMNNIAFSIIIGILRILKALIFDLSKWTIYRMVGNSPSCFFTSCKIAKSIGYWYGMLFGKHKNYNSIEKHFYRLLYV